MASAANGATLRHMDRIYAATAEFSNPRGAHSWLMGRPAYDAYCREAGAINARAYRGCPIAIVDGAIGIGLHRQRIPA